MDRLVISCGGTGGHFLPGLSIAREFQQRGGTALLLLGGKNARKQMETAEKHHISSLIFPASYPSKNPIRLFRFFLQFAAGWLKCRNAVRKFKPDALLAMGSFASLAPVFAAKSGKVPVFLHDGNTKLGKANIFLSRYARAVALSFPTGNAEKAKCPVIQTGFPLRQELIDGKRSKADAIRELNELYGSDLSPELPTVLIFGGSLGAESINRNLVISGDPGETRGIQFLRLTGRGKLEPLAGLYDRQNCKVLALESSQRMELFYSAADLVISRSGGSTVSEIAAFGKYAVLLPYPHAAENHQETNAEWLVSAGGAEILHDSDASPERFTSWIINWLNRKDEYAEKGKKSLTIARPDAARRVIDMIDNITSVKTGEQK